MTAEYYIWHRFVTLVNRKIAEPLMCHCGYLLNIVPNDEHAPLLKCYSCDSLITPGLKTIDLVRKTVEEYDRKRKL